MIFSTGYIIVNPDGQRAPNTCIFVIDKEAQSCCKPGQTVKEIQYFTDSKGMLRIVH